MIDFFITYGEHWSDWSVRLFEAAQITALLSFAGFSIALVLGAALTMAMRSSNWALRAVCRAFVELMRTVPLLALLLALYFALPPLGLTLTAFWAGSIGLGLHGSAYIAEILRGGLMSVHKGQRESALAAGLSPLQVFVRVVFPQALRVILPPLLNTYVALLKDSSLCALIATDELMRAARAISSESFLPMHIFLLVGVLYFSIAFPLSMLSRWLQSRLNRGRRMTGRAT